MPTPISGHSTSRIYETRRWITIVDPDEPHFLYTFDMEFLLSSWECSFGRGECKGHRDGHRGRGCCTYGAVLTPADRRKAAELIPRLAELGLWENAEWAAENGWAEKYENADTNTTIVERTCVFFNRHSGSENGCAFHRLAIKEGKDPTIISPPSAAMLPSSSTIANITRAGRKSFWWRGIMDLGSQSHWRAIYRLGFTSDSNQYSARTPVFERYRRAIINASTVYVADRLEEELRAEICREGEWVPVTFQGDGRLRDP